MADIKLSLFGSPILERESVRVDFGLRKSLALLAFLSIEKKVYSREELAALFWPEVGHTTALGNLRRALYRINHASEVELIIADRISIELNQAIDLWLDVDAFQSFIDACLCSSPADGPLPAACLEKLIQADNLYTADFMAGFGLPDCPAFDEWQFFQMDSLRMTYNAVLKCLVQEIRDRGEVESAIGYARRRLTLDILDESAHRDLMELYGLNNQYGAAIRQYEECCRILESELKVTPEAETTALHQAIKQRRTSASRSLAVPEIFNQYAPGKPDPKTSYPLKTSAIKKISKPGPPHNLPVQPFPFIGRRNELVEIQQLLSDGPERRLMTITGPGGIGKTRLAMEAASAVFRDFTHGVFMVSLSSLNSASDIVQAVADQIGMRSLQGNVIQEQLFEYMQDKHMLILLDSFEHLANEVTFITGLLQTAPEIKILVTSRERLGLSSETVYSLGGMEVPDHDELEDIQDYSAVQLFIQCARLVRPQLELCNQDMKTIVRICRFVQGMPLAIVLSAGWLQAINLQQIASEIEQNLDFLEGSMRDLPERQRSVRAAIEYSWKRLEKIDQTAFIKLCIFSGGFSSHSAQRVAGVSLTALRNLIDKSFIFLQQDGRYQIHALLRQFGADYLEKSGEAESIHLRHSENYLTMLGEHKEDLKGRNQIAALEEIEADFQNVRIAWEYALQEGRSSAVHTALESLFLFCDQRGYHKIGANLIESARMGLASENSTAPDPVFGSLLTHLGILRSRYERKSPEIGELIQAGVEIANRYADQKEIAFGHLALGHFYLDTMQDFSQALQYFEKSRSMFAHIGDEYYLGRAVHMIGVCHAFLNGNTELNRYLLESLEIARRIGDKNSEVMLLVSISMVSFYLGDFEATQNYAEQASHLAEDVGQGASLAQTDTFLGIIHLTRGELEQAQRYVKLGSTIAKEVNFPLPLLFSKAVSGILAGFACNLEESLQSIRECRAFPADPCSQTFILWASALVHCGAGDFDTARDEIRTLVEWDKKYDVPAILRLCLPVLSVISIIENHLPRAAEALAVEENHPLKITGWKEAWPIYAEKTTGLVNLMGEEAYQAAWERGQGKSLEVLLQDALADWDGQPTGLSEISGYASAGMDSVAIPE
jgi:predicted ATPase/DNA-binding SARP family transcriptional activator